ncbi:MULTISPECIES: patatin-like phospholipase family protein [Legionella]|uniref:Patatin-like phospholipase n=1 Tax=Legionella drozanskii LLAP-1 TaxID=1212489 RepID=A0A0W0TBF3_9GAMM|nr:MULTISPECIES: patatin-like phospholipase family protein [Legionella]KTC92929.1 patatin-like phospholipase [Legionella drozanskii LLAP-1]
MAASFGSAIEIHDNPVKKRIVLIFQGGGALGAFQAGVYEGLEKSHYTPNWIAGTSIGAINAAIIAGNEPKNRLPRLKQFWDAVTQPEVFNAGYDFPDPLRKLVADMQYQHIVLSGISVFFKPRLDSLFNMYYGPWNSFYDTEPLRAFLQELVDFDYLAKCEIRLSLGATNINTGKIRYFDSKFEKLRPEHIMASGALPPAFPPILIEGEYYWDGGVYSNTPLAVVLDDKPRVSSLCFMVDLWSAIGDLPNSIDEVKKRNLEINYSSRSDEQRCHFEDKHNLRRAIGALYKQLPKDKQLLPDNLELASLGCLSDYDIVQLEYQQKNWESSTKDADFSAYSTKERWRQGLKQVQKALKSKKFINPHPPHVGVAIYRAVED